MARLAMTADVTGDGQDPPAEPPRPAAAPEQDINPLQRLIRQRLSERGWSYGEVARRGSLPRSTVYTLATTRNLTRPPRPDTIDALAQGLDVPVTVVRAAAAASTGLHYYDQAPAGQEHPGDPDRELLIASIDELTPEDRRHVAALVESLRNRTSPPADRLAPAPQPMPPMPVSPLRGAARRHRATAWRMSAVSRAVPDAWPGRPAGRPGWRGGARPAARRRQTVALRSGWRTAPGRLPGHPVPLAGAEVSDAGTDDVAEAGASEQQEGHQRAVRAPDRRVHDREGLRPGEAGPRRVCGAARAGRCRRPGWR